MSMQRLAADETPGVNLPYLWVLCAVVTLTCLVITVKLAVGGDPDPGTLAMPVFGLVAFGLATALTYPVKPAEDRVLVVTSETSHEL